MPSKPSVDRRSVGVRYWRWRDLPFVALALLVATLAYAIDQVGGDSDDE